MLRLTTSKARPFSKTSHRQGTMWHGPAPCRVFWTMCFYVVFLISLIASQGPFQRRVTHRLSQMACCRYTPTKHTFHEWPRTLLLRLWFLNQTSLVLKKWNNQWSKVHFCSDHRNPQEIQLAKSIIPWSQPYFCGNILWILQRGRAWRRSAASFRVADQLQHTTKADATPPPHPHPPPSPPVHMYQINHVSAPSTPSMQMHNH